MGAAVAEYAVTQVLVAPNICVTKEDLGLPLIIYLELPIFRLSLLLGDHLF